MSNVFISHSSRDSSLAERVVAHLRKEGCVSVFLDSDRQDGIWPGEKWENTLYRELRSARIFVPIITEHWIASRWCFAEASHAREKGKTLVGLISQDISEPSILGDTQLISFSSDDLDQAVDRLLHSVERCLDFRGYGKLLPGRSPYPGFEAFTTQDEVTFFGRDEDVNELTETLISMRRNLTISQRFLLLLGASGSGKSSLLEAGLLPQLRRDAQHWIVLDAFRPRRSPVDELAKALALAFQRAGKDRSLDDIKFELSRAVNEGDDRRFEALSQDLQTATGKPRAHILISIDQLEELTVTSDPDAAGQFSQMLQRMLAPETTVYISVACLRSDFLGELQGHDLWRQARPKTMPLRQLGRSDIIQIIRGPAQVAGVEIDSRLVDTLADEASSPLALPLLAVVLKQLWDRFGKNGILSIDGYSTIGGMEGAIARLAESSLPSPVAKQQMEHLRDAFLKLARVRVEGSYVRRVASWDEFNPAQQKLLGSFVAARLLVAREEEGQRVVEVGHERIFRDWDRLHVWLNEDRKFLAWREEFDRDFRRWQATGLLLSGTTAVEASLWLRLRKDVLNKAEQAFIRASARRRRLKFTAIAGAAAVALFAIVALVRILIIAPSEAWMEVRIKLYKVEGSVVKSGPQGERLRLQMEYSDPAANDAAGIMQHIIFVDINRAGTVTGCFARASNGLGRNDEGTEDCDIMRAGEGSLMEELKDLNSQAKRQRGRTGLMSSENLDSTSREVRATFEEAVTAYYKTTFSEAEVTVDGRTGIVRHKEVLGMCCKLEVCKDGHCRDQVACALSDDEGKTWSVAGPPTQALDDSLERWRPSTYSLALVESPSPALLLAAKGSAAGQGGSRGGVFRWRHKDGWRETSPVNWNDYRSIRAGGKPVSIVAVVAGPDIVASGGFPENVPGVFISDDGGETWTPARSGWSPSPEEPIRLIAVLSSGEVFAISERKLWVWRRLSILERLRFLN